MTATEPGRHIAGRVNPAYMDLFAEGELARRIGLGQDMLKSCHLCPRRCGVNRQRGEIGACGAPGRAKIASVGPHFGEEKPLVGRGGSGTVFFSHCNLHCVFCQNSDISQAGTGHEVEPVQLARHMLDLQHLGCHNINLVTPTPYVPQILEALLMAVGDGLRIPLVCNCGGYESIETLQLLDGLVDIYMPDFKYGDDETAGSYSDAGDYFERCCEALAEMHNQVGVLEINEEGLARRGLLIRHLVLPNGLAGSQNVLSFIAKCLSRRSYVNIMDQYYPSYRAGQYWQLSRRIRPDEYESVLRMAGTLGLHRGFRTCALA